MTLKTRRIRYKRRLTLRPYVVLTRVKPMQKKTKKVTQQVDNGECASTQSVDKETGMEVKKVEQLSNELATFKIGEDPYAYFVNHLPSMLTAIPNLLHSEADYEKKDNVGRHSDVLPPEKQKMDYYSVSQVTYKMAETAKRHPLSKPATAFMAKQNALSSRGNAKKKDPDKINLEEQYTAKVSGTNSTKAQAQTVNQSSSLLAIPSKIYSNKIGVSWNIKANKKMWRWLAVTAPRSCFIRSGLVPRCCQQVRLGGNQVLDEKLLAEPSLLQLLSAQADLHGRDLRWLLLLLSPISSVRHFIMEQSLWAISRDCCDMPKMTLQKLTLNDYLEHLLQSDRLQADLVNFTQIIPSLVVIEKIKIVPPRLVDFFNYRLKNNVNSLFKLMINNQVVYIEVTKNQVQIYHGEDKPSLYSHSIFLAQLAHCQFNNDEKIYCERFTLGIDFRQQLALKLQQAEVNWQKYLSRHLYEFIISPDLRIGATELP